MIPSLRQYLRPEEVRGIYKSAGVELPPGEQDWGRSAKIIGTGLLGMTVGTLGSFGALELARKYHPQGGQLASKLLPFAPALGGAAGLTYALWKAREQEELKRAVKPRPDQEP